MNSLKKIYKIYNLFNHSEYDEIEKLEKKYPNLSNYSYYSMLKGLKNYFTEEQITEFVLDLKSKDPWSYAVITDSRGTCDGIEYRGYTFYIVKMQSEMMPYGLRKSSSSCVRTNNYERETSVFQVEVCVEKKDEDRYIKNLETVWYGYVPNNRYGWKKNLSDKKLKYLMDVVITQYMKA